MARTSRETIVAFESGVTWGTAASVGANDGDYITSIDNVSLQGEQVPDEAIGFADLVNYDLVAHTVAPTIVAPYRRTGAVNMLVANLFGDDTVTGADPYTHTFNWQSASTLFHTMAAEINNADIIEFPSLKVTGWEMSASGDGFLQHSFSTIGDTVDIAGDATNDGTAFDNVTYITTGLKVPLRETRFRINAQGGGALAGGDEIGITDFTLSVTRPYEEERITKGASDGTEYQTDEPIESGYPEITLSITVSDYTTIALLDDFEDQTAYKADLYWAKTVTTAFTDLIELGHLIPMPQTMGLEGGGGRYPLTRQFRAVKPSSTPTGMATSNIIHRVMVDGFSATYE